MLPANQKQELPMATMLPAEYQFIWQSNFRSRPLYLPIRNQDRQWWPCLLMDWDKMNKYYEGLVTDAYCQISVKQAKPFQRRQFFPYQPIRNNNRPWQPCLLTDRDEMRKLYEGPDIDASCQISVQLAKRFQRRRFFYISQSETGIAHGGHVC